MWQKQLKPGASFTVSSCLLIILAMAHILLSGCSSADDSVGQEPKKQIIVLFSPGGLGDMSYNDCILEGIQSFKKDRHEDAEMYIYCPESTEEGRRLFSDWLALPASDVQALFVVASSDYEPMMAECLERSPLTSNKRVLLFESNNSSRLPVTTFQISMFGPSFLAGRAIKELDMESPLIVLANPSDSPIKAAADGFKSGYGADVPVEYLADDWTGYIAASTAYRKMAGWTQKHDFIFPVAGGSNSGIYRYSREDSFSPLLAGMDVDQSALSGCIVGSVIKRIDKAVYEYLDTWLRTRELPESKVYGLESGYSDWLLSPSYRQLESLKTESMEEAIKQERNYHESL